MKTICNNKKLVEKANGLGKYGVEHTTDDKILIGSCLVYEDDLWGNVETTVKELAGCLGLGPINEDNYDDYVDDFAEIRDFILDKVLKHHNKKLVIGNLPY